ncbi:hypothetical protein ccbrp13_17100 [Ktedonobacteria bacterium brp13]|nr:hypothetical protein ccbrp13_17100 [Ktedonobacteria bacterium brp13]
MPRLERSTPSVEHSDTPGGRSGSDSDAGTSDHVRRQLYDPSHNDLSRTQSDRKKQANKRYNGSTKGQERNKRYDTNYKGKARYERYKDSTKGRERDERYKDSTKGRERDERYNTSALGKAHYAVKKYDKRAAKYQNPGLSGKKMAEQGEEPGVRASRLSEQEQEEQALRNEEAPEGVLWLDGPQGPLWRPTPEVMAQQQGIAQSRMLPAHLREQYAYQQRELNAQPETSGDESEDSV